MKIQQFRNATLAIEAGDKVILVDPMIGPKGTIPPFAFVRFKPQGNPIVPLPAACAATLERVTHCLITHQHADHIDQDGEAFLKRRNIPVICSQLDEQDFKKKGLNVVQTVAYWKRAPFLGGAIEGIPAKHGYGYVAKRMGNVMGFYIELPGQPSIYLSSDTIYTDDVEKVLQSYKPHISVVAAGSAQLDFFQPILMKPEDIVKFTRTAPGRVIANHLEALNHCPASRTGLEQRYRDEGLLDKVFIPADGEWVEINRPI